MPMNPIYNRLFLITALAVLLNLFPAADCSAREMTMAECIDSARVSNGLILAGDLDIEKAGIMKGTAFDPEATSFILQQETTGGGSPDNGVVISQNFEFPTVYVARSHTLKAQEELQRSRKNITINEISAEIASAYQSALLVKKQLELNDSLSSTMDYFLKISRGRFAEGECSRLEVINAERAVETCHRDHDALLAELEAYLTRLTLLTGISEKVEIPASEQLGLLAAPTPSFIYGSTPPGEEFSNRILIAEKEINLEKQKFFPSISLGVTLQALIKSFNPYHVERERFKPGNFMAFEAGISVPLFFWAQNSRLKAARTELAATRMQQEYAAGEAESEYKALLLQLEAALSNIKSFDEKSLPQAEEIDRLARISYEYGEIDYVEYVSNIQNAHSIREDYARAIDRYNQIVVKLNQLLGKQ